MFESWCLILGDYSGCPCTPLFSRTLQEDCGFVVEMVSGCKYMLLIVYDMLQNQLIVGSEYYAATIDSAIAVRKGSIACIIRRNFQVCCHFFLFPIQDNQE